MDDSRIDLLTALLERALDMPSAQRSGFLRQACGDDTALHDELVSLLAADESATGFFDQLAEQIVSPAYAAVAGSARARRDATLLPQLQAALGSAYRIERELGGGAMSRVFLAEETRLGRKVVIKVLPPEMIETVSAQRFRREIQLAAQLQHPHIVPLLASDSAGGFLYYTMPFVAGESLRARLARDGALSVADARTIWRNVLDALAHAHASGVVHRDIKPANILLSGRNALVADFGIARAIEAASADAESTGTGLTVGTPAYMAPEQVEGTLDADHRVDIYAAGLVMYEMLEGIPPFSGGSARELVLARLTQDPPEVSREDCPPELKDLVMHCLARNPAARPESAEQVLAAIESSFTTRETAVAVARPRLRLRRAVYGLAAVVVIAAAFTAWQTRDATGVSRAPAQRSLPSLAVLPLANLGTEARDSALARGMTEELIATLSRVPNLRVIGATSVFALRDRHLSTRAIAESLRVSHVLEGGLQRVGSHLRMQVRLVDARDASARWSATYDREMEDVFAVQDDISRAIASELDVRLVGAASRGSMRRRHAPNVAAYESYLRGMDLTLMRSRTGMQQALAHFNRAIELDPTFAAAYAAQVNVYVQMAGATARDYGEWFARGEAAALKAVALDDSLAEAHVALGWIRIVTRNWEEAEAALGRGIALDPNATRGYEGLARVYAMTGRPGQQLAAATRGLEIDPFSQNAMREMALALNFNGRCDAALHLLRPLKSLEPPYAPAGVIRGLCYAQKKLWPEAVAEFRWTAENTGGRAALAFLGYALARAGREDEARVILSDLITGRTDSHGAFGMAIVYAGLRDNDRAFELLDRAVEEHSIRVYLMDPVFGDLHRDPRFERLKRKLGL